VGTYVFDGNSQEKLYQDLAAQFNPPPAPVTVASEPEVMADNTDSQ